jgi:hypothetical protein
VPTLLPTFAIAVPRTFIFVRAGWLWEVPVMLKITPGVVKLFDALV